MKHLYLCFFLCVCVSSFAAAVAHIRHLQSLKYESLMLLFILLLICIWLIVLSSSSDVFVSYGIDACLHIMWVFPIIWDYYQCLLQILKYRCVSPIGNSHTHWTVLQFKLIWNQVKRTNVTALIKEYANTYSLNFLIIWYFQSVLFICTRTAEWIIHK